MSGLRCQVLNLGLVFAFMQAIEKRSVGRWPLSIRSHNLQSLCGELIKNFQLSEHLIVLKCLAGATRVAEM